MAVSNGKTRLTLFSLCFSALEIKQTCRALCVYFANHYILSTKHREGLAYRHTIKVCQTDEMIVPLWNIALKDCHKISKWMLWIIKFYSLFLGGCNILPSGFNVNRCVGACCTCFPKIHFFCANPILVTLGSFWQVEKAAWEAGAIIKGAFGYKIPFRIGHKCCV